MNESKKEFTVTLYVLDCVKVGEDYKPVESKARFKFDDWDDVNNLIGYMVEGTKGKSLKFEIREERT